MHTWVARVASLEAVQGLRSSSEDVYIEDSASFVICQNSIGSVIIQSDQLRGGRTPACAGGGGFQRQGWVTGHPLLRSGL